MRKVLCVLLILLAGSSWSMANESSVETLGLQNGRFWNDIPSESRRYFIWGIFDGWNIRQFSESYLPVKLARAMQSGNARFAGPELADMVNSVYRESENLSLPVGWVVMACLAIQRGDTSRDAVFTALRKHLSTTLGKKEPHPLNEDDAIDVILNSRTR